jgi:glycosyltransferase involved in cell wall biosynthesis
VTGVIRHASAPLVSIIIPCFNAGAMIERCIRSCLRQSHPAIEIVLVDNNSTDDSVARAVAIARRSGRPLIVERCPEQGVNHARRLGFKRAAGDYIQWLDADDELAQDKIGRQVRALAKHPEFDLAYGDWDTTSGVRS